MQLSLVSSANELWPTERPDGMPNIVSLEVMCAKDHMDVHLTFSHPFEGIVSSKGKKSLILTTAWTIINNHFVIFQVNTVILVVFMYRHQLERHFSPFVLLMLAVVQNPI